MRRHDEGYFSARDNTRLFWRFDAPEGEAKAHIAIIHGYGDHAGRYARTIEALNAEGFAVHAFDYRGHGRADGRRGFASDWSHFIDDLKLFLERVKRETGGKKLFVLAHSHGALMMIHHLHRDIDGIAGVVLSAPYLKLAITPPKLKLLVSKIAGRLAPGLQIPSELTIEHLTCDSAIQEETRRDPLYGRTVTPGWFRGSLVAQLEALRYAPAIYVPAFVFCGEKDGVALPATARVFFESLGSPDKKFREYPGMRHECLNEVGRAGVYEDIIGWISARL